MFTQWDKTGQSILEEYKIFLIRLEIEFHISFKDLKRDMAMRFLNEIEEYEMVGE